MFSIKGGLFAKPSMIALAAIASMGGSLVSAPAFANETEEFNSVSSLLDNQDSMGQVTSVSQLSDVQPTDWAFQALQSLVERYGCIAGYPDGTFRGNRAATRYEMAAALNACLDNISDKFATKEDLEAVKALQEEFQAELATLRGRVDGLEARTSTLEAQQFSTTTKLKGEAVFSVGYVADDDGPLDSVQGVATDGINAPSDRVFFGQRARLNFQTSFNGKDLLRTRLQAINIPNLSGDAAQTEQARLGISGNSNSNFELNELFYKFKPADKITAKVAVIGGDYKDDVETFNPYLKSSGSGALSRFFRVNPVVHRAPGDTTASVTVDLSDSIEWSVMYAAKDANSPIENNGEGGLFGGTFGAMTQVAVTPSDNFRFGVSYAYSDYEGNDADITRGTADSPALGGFASADTSEPFGDVDTRTHNFGLNIDTKISSGINFSGWAGLTIANTNAAVNEEVKLINWAANLVFPDLFAEGNRGAIAFGQTPYIFDSGNLNIDDSVNSTNFLAEAQYQFKVSDNIKITPGVIAVINANNTSSNDVIVIPVVRTTFKF